MNVSMSTGEGPLGLIWAFIHFSCLFSVLDSLVAYSPSMEQVGVSARDPFLKNKGSRSPTWLET